MAHKIDRTAEVKLLINVHLLGICFTLFVIVTAFKPDIMRNSFFTMQLVLAIPFFLSASFARSKSVGHKMNVRWERFAYLTFIFGYSFLLNSTGILLTTLAGNWTAFPFFFASIILAILYSYLQVKDDKTKLGRRIFRDSLFAVMVIILGLLPSVGVFSGRP